MKHVFILLALMLTPNASASTKSDFTKIIVKSGYKIDSCGLESPYYVVCGIMNPKDVANLQVKNGSGKAHPHLYSIIIKQAKGYGWQMISKPKIVMDGDLWTEASFKKGKITVKVNLQFHQISVVTGF